jgi:hypothetical protein
MNVSNELELQMDSPPIMYNFSGALWPACVHFVGIKSQVTFISQGSIKIFYNYYVVKMGLTPVHSKNKLVNKKTTWKDNSLQVLKKPHIHAQLSTNLL